MAILTNGLIYLSLIAAFRAMAALRNSYRSRFANEDASLPAIQISGPIRQLGLTAPALLPLVFIAVWLFLWLRGLR